MEICKYATQKEFTKGLFPFFVLQNVYLFPCSRRVWRDIDEFCVDRFIDCCKYYPFSPQVMIMCSFHVSSK